MASRAAKSAVKSTAKSVAKSASRSAAVAVAVAAASTAAAAAAAAARVCHALGHPDRLRLVALLVKAEGGVGALQRALGLRQAATSRHLAVLRGAQVVAARRDGGRVYYRIGVPAEPLAAATLRAVVRALAAAHRI